MMLFPFTNCPAAERADAGLKNLFRQVKNSISRGAFNEQIIFFLHFLIISLPRRRIAAQKRVTDACKTPEAAAFFPAKGRDIAELRNFDARRLAFFFDAGYIK